MRSCHAFSLFLRLAIPLCQLPASILKTCLYVELHFETLSMKHCDSARQLKINLGNIIVTIEAEKFYWSFKIAWSLIWYFIWRFQMSMGIPGRAAATTDPTLVRDDPPPLLLLLEWKSISSEIFHKLIGVLNYKILGIISNNFLPNVGCCSSRYDCDWCLRYVGGYTHPIHFPKK